MKKHKHKLLDYCICGALAEEPDEKCPKHGTPYPLQCMICGQFMKHTKPRISTSNLVTY
jgi:hypothetical protein